MRTFTEEYNEFLTTHKFTSVNAGGLEFEVIDSGSGSRAVIFLNGVDMYQFWIKYVCALEKNYRVVMMKYPLKVWKNTEMAAALKALFTKLGIDSPILVGISDGGVLAQLYAKLYMVGGLIMVSTLTVDSTYVESVKKEKLFMPLMKVYIKNTKFDKLRVRLVESVKKHFRNETDEEKNFPSGVLNVQSIRPPHLYSARMMPLEATLTAPSAMNSGRVPAVIWSAYTIMRLPFSYFSG